jgi:hypothetical protein
MNLKMNKKGIDSNIASELVQIKLTKEPFIILEKGKKVIQRDAEGKIQYLRNDAIGLMGLLSAFDSRIHALRECSVWVKLRNKVREAYLEENKDNTLSLTIEEANFLKDYLKNFKENEGKNIQMKEFEIRTIVGLLEEVFQN